MFTDPDTDSSVAIAYDHKTRLWSVTGILANTWRIEPYTFWSRPPACAADTCLPCSWHAVTRVNMTQLRGDGAADYVLADTEGGARSSCRGARGSTGRAARCGPRCSSWSTTASSRASAAAPPPRDSMSSNFSTLSISGEKI